MKLSKNSPTQKNLEKEQQNSAKENTKNIIKIKAETNEPENVKHV